MKNYFFNDISEYELGKCYTSTYIARHKSQDRFVQFESPNDTCSFEHVSELTANDCTLILSSEEMKGYRRQKKSPKDWEIWFLW